MKIIKNGEGKATHPANLGKVFLTITTKSLQDKGLIDLFCKDLTNFKTVILGVLSRYGYSENLLKFSEYKKSAKYRRVEVKNEDKTAYKDELEYHYITGYFSIELPFEDNRKVFAELLLETNNLGGGINIDFTLTENTFASLKAQATNNAIDNIHIEIRGIAEHLGYDCIELATINFNFKTQSYGTFDEARMMKCSSAPTNEEKIKVLDEMLSEANDITVTSVFESIWEIY